jgi:hypothetical protein
MPHEEKKFKNLPTPRLTAAPKPLRYREIAAFVAGDSIFAIPFTPTEEQEATISRSNAGPMTAPVDRTHAAMYARVSTEASLKSLTDRELWSAFQTAMVAA